MKTTTLTVTQEDLRIVLNAIHYVHPLPETGLHDFLEAKGILCDTMTDLLREHIVSTWLADLITSHYNTLRRNHGLCEVQVNLPKADLIRLIAEDYQNRRHDLEQWSVLFVFYICGSVFSIKDHAKIACLHPRSLRRRRKYGIHQLLIKIISS